MQALSLSQFVVDGWKQLAQPKITYADGTVEEIPQRSEPGTSS
jgi:hypothetical protein